MLIYCIKWIWKWINFIKYYGNIKIWNINNYYNFQSLNSSDNILYEINLVKKGDENQFKKNLEYFTIIIYSKNEKDINLCDEFVLYEKGKVIQNQRMIILF